MWGDEATVSEPLESYADSIYRSQSYCSSRSVTHRPSTIFFVSFTCAVIRARQIKVPWSSCVLCTHTQQQPMFHSFMRTDLGYHPRAIRCRYIVVGSTTVGSPTALGILLFSVVTALTPRGGRDRCGVHVPSAESILFVTYMCVCRLRMRPSHREPTRSFTSRGGERAKKPSYMYHVWMNW